MTTSKKRTTAQRGKGRPARDQRRVGREALIAATTKLLKKHSLDEITRAQLSREAGIDPSLIRYYFSSLASLLTEGMRDIFTELQSRRATIEADASLHAQLRRRIGTLIEVLEENPQLHQLLMRPVLDVEPSKAKEVEALRRQYTLASLETLQSVLSHAATTGEFGTTDVPLFYILIVGIAEFAVKCPQYFDLVEVSQDTRAETLSRYIDFVVDLLINGLRPRPELGGRRGAPDADKAAAKIRRRR